MTGHVSASLILGWVVGSHVTNLGQQSPRGLDRRTKALALISARPVRAFGRRDRRPSRAPRTLESRQVHVAHCSGGASRTVPGWVVPADPRSPDGSCSDPVQGQGTGAAPRPNPSPVASLRVHTCSVTGAAASPDTPAVLTLSDSSKPSRRGIAALAPLRASHLISTLPQRRHRHRQVDHRLGGLARQPRAGGVGAQPVADLRAVGRAVRHTSIRRSRKQRDLAKHAAIVQGDECVPPFAVGGEVCRERREAPRPARAAAPARPRAQESRVRGAIGSPRALEAGARRPRPSTVAAGGGRYGSRSERAWQR